ncbi:MAG: sulfotransferase [Rubripirellula sp.]|jgi:hypothetical protein|nr:sulfotransferase [Rubripirellula sp.]
MNDSTNKDINVSRRVFIIGCPRSGSTWLSLLLSQHPEVAVFQHAKFMQYLRSLYAWWGTKDVKFGKLVVSATGNAGELPDEESERPLRYGTILTEQECLSLCRTAADQIFQAVARQKTGAKVVVDKTPESGHIARFIQKVYPNAYFLHVVRDPRSVVSSLKHAGKSWAKGEFPTNAINAAEYWNNQVAIGQKVMEHSPNYMQVRYEDLKQTGVNQLKNVYEFLGLGAEEELCAQALQACSMSQLKKDRGMPDGFFRRGELASWREDLSSHEVKMIEYITADTMKRLGYEPTMSPYRRPPFRLWCHRVGSRFLDWLDNKLRRIVNRLYAMWIGRLPDLMPEFIVY